MIRTIDLFFKRYLAQDDAARTLQLAGLLRFTLIFLQGIILIKAGVPIAIVGQLELVFFAINFFQFFWQNGGHQAMLSWKKGEERSLASGAIFGGMHLQALVGAGLVWILAFVPVSASFEFVLDWRNLGALSVYVFFSVPVGAIVYQYLVQGKLNKILWYTLLSHGVQAAIVVFLLGRGTNVEFLIDVLAGYAFARWLVVLIAGRFFRDGIPSLKAVLAFFVFAIPLVLHAFNSGVMDYVDGWIVSFFYGDEMFALYRYGAREMPLNALMVAGLVSGLIHRFSGDAKVEASVLKSESLRAIRLLLPLSCVLILLSPLLYRILYNAEFIFSARIFNIYALTVLSRVILSQVYAYVHHQNWVLTWSTFVEIVVNIVLSLILMEYLGLIGIPVATVIAYALQKLFLIIYVQRRFGIPFRTYIPVKACIWYFSATIASVIISELIYF